MVLAAAQVTSFFETSTQMMIPHETRTQLKYEDTDTSEHLVEFDEDLISKISENLKRIGVRVPYLNPGSVAGVTIPTPTFTFFA